MLTESALARPRATLAIVAGGLVLAAALAIGTAGRVGLAPADAVRSESERVADRLVDRLGHEPAPGVVVVASSRESIDSAVSRVTLDVLSSRLQTTPGVVAVERGPVSRDGRTTALTAYFRDDDPGASAHALGELRDGLDPGGLEIAVGGQAGVLDDARRGLWVELGPLELLALPATVLVLALAFGVRLAAAPALSVAGGVLGSAGATGVINELVPVSAVAFAAGSVVATVLGIEASLAIVTRYRREASALGGGEDALRSTMASTGRTVTFAALAAVAVSACAAFVPVLDARSVALGGVLAAPLTAAAALAATPSILVLAERARPTPISPAPPEARQGVSGRIELAVLRWRALVPVVVLAPVAALVALAAPGWDAETVPLNSAALPDDADARRAEARIVSALGSEVTAPAIVDPGDEASGGVERRLASRAGVAGVGRSPLTGSAPRLVAATEARPGSLGARDAVGSLRDAGVEVGGRDAEALDADRALWRWLPVAGAAGAIALGGVVLIAFGGALSRTRRALCAALLSIASLLPAAAAGGLLVLVFGDGRLAGPLDYQPLGGPILGALVASLAIVGTVSALRTATLAAASAEPPRPRVEPEASLAATSAGALDTAAAATVVAAVGAAVLLGSDLLAAQQLGLGVAAGVVFDVVLVRALVGPGLIRLFW
ncbi:MAG TPA: MMPL family transporter [Solirubrobacterales bacterium]|nr:MMPL family transporter [Solirubrobacterales bacterium]